MKEEGKDNFCVIGVYIGNNSVCWITAEKLQQLRKWITETRDKKFQEVLQSRDDKGYIRALNFEDNDLRTTGVSLLLEWTLESLEELNLTACNIDEKGIEALSSNSKWPKLQSLNLLGNNLGDEECQLLVRNSTWKNLKILMLDHNKIGELGVKELVKNNTWVDLAEISLGDNEIGDQGAFLFGSSEN